MGDGLKRATEAAQNTRRGTRLTQDKYTACCKCDFGTYLLCRGCNKPLCGTCRHSHRLILSPAARKIWDVKHRDYRCIRADGVPCVLYINPKTGGTEFWPVEAVAKEPS
jgi:hypothetical protein